MAGTDPGFNAAEVRDALQFAMNMGLPETEEDRPTFHWSTTRSWAQADAAGHPFDWAATPTSVDLRDPVQALCAVEILEARAGEVDETLLGTFDTVRAKLTFLDEDYALVEDFDWVLLGGKIYVWARRLPPTGLFDMTVHQVLVVARDQS